MKRDHRSWSLWAVSGRFASRLEALDLISCLGDIHGAVDQSWDTNQEDKTLLPVAAFLGVAAHCNWAVHYNYWGDILL